MNREIIIRASTKADLPEVAQLAALDSRRAPAGDVLLAYVDHELRAAVDLDSGDAVADPFHHTADLVELLQARVELVSPQRARVRRPRLRIPRVRVA